MALLSAYTQVSLEVIAARQTDGGSDRTVFLRQQNARVADLEAMWRQFPERSCLISPYDLIGIL